MRVAMKNHALPVYKKNRIASLLCIFESTINMSQGSFQDTPSSTNRVIAFYIIFQAIFCLLMPCLHYLKYVQYV